MSMPKGLIILGDLQDQDLIWLATAGTVRKVDSGTVLITQGQPVDDLFFVTDGTVVVEICGREVVTLGIGEILGEMSFVEKRPPGATVRAKTDCRVLAIPRTDLLAHFRQNQAFAARFYRALAVFLSDRLRSMNPGDEAELDEGLLDTLHVAGDRMLRLIDLLEGHR